MVHPDEFSGSFAAAINRDSVIGPHRCHLEEDIGDNDVGGIDTKVHTIDGSIGALADDRLIVPVDVAVLIHTRAGSGNFIGHMNNERFGMPHKIAERKIVCGINIGTTEPSSYPRQLSEP